MSEEKKFDELLSSKLSEREFPFNELNWDEAERLIVKQERWGKISRMSLVFAAGLVAGVVIMSPFLLSNHNNISTPVVVKSNTVQNPVLQDNVPVVTNQPKESTKTINSSKEVRAPRPAQSAFVKTNNSIGMGGAPSNLSPKTKIEAESPVLSGNKKTRTIYKNPRKQNSDLIASARMTKKTKKTVQAEEISSMEPKNDINAPKPVEDKTPVIASSSAKNKETKTTDANKTNTDIPNSTSGESNDLNTSGGIRLNAMGEPKKDTVTAKSDILMIPGTQNNAPVYSANILSVYAGGSYSLGWSGNDGKEGNDFTVLGGFTYTHCFNRKFSALVGVGYSELNKLNQTYTSNAIQYDFGENASVTTVTPQKIYYLAVPLKFQWNIDDKDLLGLGLDFLFMLTTSSAVTTYQQTYFGETGMSTKNQNGYVQGFNDNDFQLTFAYTRMLTDRLGIKAEYYYGLAYIENTSFPGINQYGRNTGFRLVLSYQLMK